MGRHLKLTDFQAAEIQRRMAAGEPTRALAREFKVGEATLRRNFSAHTAKIQSVANRLASAEVEMAELPISAQMSVRSFADHLKTINNNVARAVRAGSETAAFLSEAAQSRARESILKEPTADGRKVDIIAAMEADGLQIAANRALSPAMRLIVATMGKDTPEDEPGDLSDYTTLTLEELDEAERLALKARGELA